MAVADEELIRVLVDEDAELARCVAEHQKIEQKLAELKKRRFLTPSEAQEKKALQVRKLARRDEIERILVQYRNNERVIF